MTFYVGKEDSRQSFDDMGSVAISISKQRLIASIGERGGKK